jgi:hypothetical protein
LSKVRISYIIEAAWNVKVKLTGLVVRDVELTQKEYLHATTIICTTITTATTTSTTVTTTTTATTTTSTSSY